jgi:hypothetical protein
MAQPGLDPIQAAGEAYEAQVVHTANTFAERIVIRGGVAHNLGEFTIAMHGFALGVDTHSVHFGEPLPGFTVRGAHVGQDEIIDRYRALEDRFSHPDFDVLPVAEIESLTSDEDAPGQIVRIAIPAKLGFYDDDAGLQYRIRKVRRSIDPAASTSTQHGYLGTLELPVRSLVTFREDGSAAESGHQNVVIASTARTRQSRTMHNRGSFFEDRYFIGLEEILDQADVERRRSQEDAAEEVLFLERSLAAKKLAVAASKKKFSR